MSDSDSYPNIRHSAHHGHERKPDGTGKEFRLGVLLVHGVGTQPARDTLVRWGDALITLIGQATQPPVELVLSRASPGDRSGEKQAEVVVKFYTRPTEEKWLLTEAWWADSFPAPRYSELVSWSVRALPWSITLHIAQRYWHVKSHLDASRSAKLIGFWMAVMAVFQLLVALALSPVFVALLAVTLLLGVLPIPQLRTLILSTQSILLGTVGDSLAFVESPLRAALIKTRILDGLTRLQARCAKTIIIAHSQGAAATLDALRGIMATAELAEDATVPPTPEPATVTSTESPPEGPVPDTLVTFGSGVNQLVSLKVLSGGLPEKTFKIGSLNPASLGVGAVVAMFVWCFFLYAGIRSGRITVTGLLQTAGLYAIALSIAGLILWYFKKGGKVAKGKKKEEEIPRWKMVLVISLVMAPLFALFILAETYDLPLGTVVFLLPLLLFLAASLTLILSPDMKKIVTARVRKPPGLDLWVDLYASADPVPNGPTRIKEERVQGQEPALTGIKEVERESQEPMLGLRIWNRGSILSDHTTYWENLDGFVLRVVRACAETAKSPWAKDALPPITCYSEERAAWRVDYLRWALRFNMVMWVAFAVLWTRRQVRVPVPFELPSWFPVEAQMIAQFVVLVLLVAAAVWAAAALVRWPWSLWVRAEQKQVLTHDSPTDTPLPAMLGVAGMWMVISLLLFSLYSLAQGDFPKARELLDNPGDALVLLIAICGCGVILASLAYLADLVFRWLRSKYRAFRSYRASRKASR